MLELFRLIAGIQSHTRKSKLTDLSRYDMLNQISSPFGFAHSLARRPGIAICGKMQFKGEGVFSHPNQGVFAAIT